MLAPQRQRPTGIPSEYLTQTYIGKETHASWSLILSYPYIFTGFNNSALPAVRCCFSPAPRQLPAPTQGTAAEPPPPNPPHPPSANLPLGKRSSRQDGRLTARAACCTPGTAAARVQARIGCEAKAYCWNVYSTQLQVLLSSEYLPLDCSGLRPLSSADEDKLHGPTGTASDCEGFVYNPVNTF